MLSRSIVAACLLAVAAFAVGCRAQDAPIQVSSPWPVANTERTVPRPAEPPTWPLTGLPAPTAGSPEQIRVVSVKIENSPAARPQSGLQSADVVYESITEGGITRFNCLFHSQVPSTVGPVRSARLSDIDIVPQYSALFVFSGASGSVNAAVRTAGLENLSQDAGVSAGYSRSSKRPRPHNLYVDLPKIRQEAVRRGMTATQVTKALEFERRAVEQTTTVTKVTIPFSTANTVVWSYDSETDSYARANNGAAHQDALTAAQIKAKNVVVMWAKVSPAAKRDVTGSLTYDIELVGSNRASVFRNGQRFDGTWEAGADSPPRFTAADGTRIRLAPGNTWFQVVSTNVNISMQ